MLKVWVTLERSSGCDTRSRSAWKTTSTTVSTTPGAASESCSCCCRRYRASPGRWLSRSSSSSSLAWPRSTTCYKKCFWEVSSFGSRRVTKHDFWTSEALRSQICCSEWMLTLCCPSGSANEAPHTPHSLHPHLVQEHLSSNVIVASNMPTPIHNGQICKYETHRDKICRRLLWHLRLNLSLRHIQ